MTEFEGADTDNMSDNELRAFVRDRLEEQDGFDADDIEVAVREGAVFVSGRVGTEQELRVIDHVLTDVLSLESVTNDIVVDALRRAESPLAIDQHLADEEAHEGLILGDRPLSVSPEAAHLVDNMQGELHGTTDVQEAIEGAIPWTPPDSPTPEGLGGTEAQSDDR